MKHPATQYDYRRLSDEFAARCGASLVKESVAPDDADLSLFCYTQRAVFDHAWDEFVEMARGIVLSRREQRVVAYTFPKFFNFGERSITLPDEPFEVFEKLDGSLGVLFHDGRRWRVTTKGSFTSEQAVWAENWIFDHANLGFFVLGRTYLFEILSRWNRIVVRYDWEGLVLLAIYDEHGHELDLPADPRAMQTRLSPDDAVEHLAPPQGVEDVPRVPPQQQEEGLRREVPSLGDGLRPRPRQEVDRDCAAHDRVPDPTRDQEVRTGVRELPSRQDLEPIRFKIALRHSYRSMDEIKQAVETFGADREGFVIRFSSGYRLKIKGAEYLRIHRLISQVTPLALWDILANGGDPTVIRKDIPEEFYADFDLIHGILVGRLDKLVRDVEEWKARLLPDSDKQVGLALGTLPEAVRLHIFNARKKGERWFEDPRARLALYRSFRPTGNVLDGYQPSAIVNRVAADEG